MFLLFFQLSFFLGEGEAEGKGDARVYGFLLNEVRMKMHFNLSLIVLRAKNA